MKRPRQPWLCLEEVLHDSVVRAFTTVNADSQAVRPVRSGQVSLKPRKAEDGGWCQAMTEKNFNLVAYHGMWRACDATWPTGKCMSSLEREDMAFLFSNADAVYSISSSVLPWPHASKHGLQSPHPQYSIGKDLFSRDRTLTNNSPLDDGYSNVITSTSINTIDRARIIEI
jgi:hypothetical protein